MLLYREAGIEGSAGPGKQKRKLDSLLPMIAGMWPSLGTGQPVRTFPVEMEGCCGGLLLSREVWGPLWNIPSVPGVGGGQGRPCLVSSGPLCGSFSHVSDRSERGGRAWTVFTGSIRESTGHQRDNKAVLSPKLRSWCVVCTAAQGAIC